MTPIIFEVENTDLLEKAGDSNERLILPYPYIRMRLYETTLPQNVILEMEIDAYQEEGRTSFVVRHWDKGKCHTQPGFYLEEAGSDLNLHIDRRATPEERQHIRENTSVLAFSFVYKLVSALACSNVRTEKRTRPKKPKTRWGKPPKGVDTYHILTVDVTATDESPEGSPSAGSPRRQHWRRGHIRRLRDGRQIWVQPHLAGDPERGFVDKDYRVTGDQP